MKSGDYSQMILDQSQPKLRNFLPLKSPSAKMDWNSYKSYEDHLIFYHHLVKSFKDVGVSNHPLHSLMCLIFVAEKFRYCSKMNSVTQYSIIYSLNL